MASQRQMLIQEQLATVAALVERPQGATVPQICDVLDISLDIARARVKTVGQSMHLFKHQSKDNGTMFTEVRYFANEAHYQHFVNGGDIEEAPVITSEFGDLRHPAPRTLLEGLAPLPTFINPPPTQRDGSDEARGLPSRRGNVLVYRDGTREPLHASA